MVRATAALALSAVLALGAAVPTAQSAAAGGPNTAVSDGPVTVRLTLRGGHLEYDVADAGSPVLRGGRLGVRTNQADLTDHLHWAAAPSPVVAVDQSYWLPTGRRRRVTSQAVQRTFSLRGDHGARMNVQVRVWRTGFAFRYRVPGRGWQDVRSEATSFPVKLPGDGGLQVAQPQTPSQPRSEEFYHQRGQGFPTIGARSPSSAGWAFPMLLRSTNAAGASQWLLLSEATGDATYPVTHLNQPAVARHRATYTIAFPRNRDNGPGGGDPYVHGTWSSPWRFVEIGSSLSQIYASTAETDLASPNATGGTSWIRPGSAAWAYVKQPQAATSLPSEQHLMDVAHEMGWPYLVVDAGWDHMTDGNGKPLGSRQQILSVLSQQAAARGLRLFVWYAGPEQLATARQRNRVLSMLNAAGIAGIKADMWNSDKQNSVQERTALLQAAARHHVMVLLHNVTVPRGLERTYPNLVGTEAGIGVEYYRTGLAYGDQMPDDDVTEAVLRGIFGTFDAGPVLFEEPIASADPRRTTPAHELATAVTDQSGLRSLADAHGYLGIAAPIHDFLSREPVVWDESRLLSAQIGTSAVVARRSGRTWYIGGLNGATDFVSPTPYTSDPGYRPPVGHAVSVGVDLARLGCTPTQETLFSDGSGHDASGITVSNPTGTALNVLMAPFGGFVLVATCA